MDPYYLRTSFFTDNCPLELNLFIASLLKLLFQKLETEFSRRLLSVVVEWETLSTYCNIDISHEKQTQDWYIKNKVLVYLLSSFTQVYILLPIVWSNQSMDYRRNTLINKSTYSIPCCCELIMSLQKTN